MPELLPDLTKIGQAALSLPKAVMDTETRQITEKMSVLSTEMQKLAAGLPGIVPAGLPALPTLPGLPGAVSAVAPAVMTRAEAVRGVRKTKARSYLEV